MILVKTKPSIFVLIINMICFPVVVWMLIDATSFVDSTFISHPLFYQRVNVFQEPFRLWQMIWPLIDRKGNVAYADFDSNYLVIVHLGGGRIYPGRIFPKRLSSNTVVLMPDTKGEATVTRENDALIYVSCANQRQCRFPLPPGMARQWYDELIEKTGSRPDMMQMICDKLSVDRQTLDTCDCKSD
jgi:hypothetical protein